jgi:hypothetical protein
MAGRLQSEQVAEFVGMLEGSTRSRDTNRAGIEMRDLVEAGLNEAAVCVWCLWALSTDDGSGVVH